MRLSSSELGGFPENDAPDESLQKATCCDVQDGLPLFKIGRLAPFCTSKCVHFWLINRFVQIVTL